jgi:hypothetical protein
MTGAATGAQPLGSDDAPYPPQLGQAECVHMANQLPTMAERAADQQKLRSRAEG